MVSRDRVLSSDFLVCVKIYEYNEEKREKIWFSKLVDVMRGELSQSTISKCLDRLFDLGMIDGTWESIDGRWTRTLKVTGESMGFVGDLYRATKENRINNRASARKVEDIRWNNELPQRMLQDNRAG